MPAELLEIGQGDLRDIIGLPRSPASDTVLQYGDGIWESQTLANLGIVAGDISDFDAQVQTSRLDQMANPTSNIDLNSNRIINLTDPVNDQDAVTKSYADENAGETNTIANLGTGTGIYAQKNGVEFQFKSLIGGTNITLSNNATTITITGLGEGITTINGDSSATQNFIGGVGLSLLTSGSTHTFRIDATVATLAGSQTLTNKTIDGNNNTISNLALGAEVSGTLAALTDVSTPSANRVLQRNAANTAYSWVLFPASGETNTASNVGTGNGVFAQKSGVDLQFKSLVGGTNVTITNTGTTITISAVSNATGGAVDTINGNNSAAQIIAGGNGIDVVDSGATHTLSISAIVATLAAAQILTNKTINADNNTITNLALGDEVSGDLSDLTDIPDPGANQILQRNSANDAYSWVALPAGTGGESNTASNLGTGEGVFGQKSGVDLQFKSLVAGDDVSLSSTATAITIGLSANIPRLDEDETISGTWTFDERVEAEGNLRVANGTNGEAAIEIFRGGGAINARTGAADFVCVNSSNIDVITASFDSVPNNLTAGEEEANFRFRVIEGGVLTTYMNLGFDDLITFQRTLFMNTRKITGVGDPTEDQDAATKAYVDSNSGSGESNTASNLGAGEGIFTTKSGVNLPFKSLVAGTNVSISSNATTITIGATGQGGTGGAIDTINGNNTPAQVIAGGNGIDIVDDGATHTIAIATIVATLAATQTLTNKTIDADDNTISNLAIGSEVSGNLSDLADIPDPAANQILQRNGNNSAYTWVALPSGGGSGEINTASNLGDGTGVFAQKNGVDLQFKGLEAGNNIVISNTATGITLAVVGGGIVGNTDSINGSTISAQIIAGGTGITVSDSGATHTIAITANSITNAQLATAVFASITGLGAQSQNLNMNSNKIINLTDPTADQDAATKAYVDTNAGEDNTISNIGTGAQVAGVKSGVNFPFRSLIGGDNITITQNANDITIVGTATSGETNTASNLAGGTGLFAEKDGVDLEFKSLVAGSNITITNTASTVTINSTGGGGGGGETNTGANLGTGVGVFAQKFGVELEFKSLISGTDIAITAGDEEITLGTTNIVPKTNAAATITAFWEFGNNLRVSNGTDEANIQIRRAGGTSNVRTGGTDFVCVNSDGEDVVTASFNSIPNNLTAGEEEANFRFQVIEKGALATYMNLGFDDLITMQRTLFMNNHFITSVLDPVNDQDAATKAYVDSNAGQTNTASNLGNGAGVYASKNGSDLRFRSLVGGTGITLSTANNTITISGMTGGGQSNTTSNSGNGAGLALAKSGVNLPFKSLIGGTNITLTEQANTITIAASGGGGSGEANTASNLGAGAGQIFAQKDGVDLEFKTLAAGSGISITSTNNFVTIAATGGGAGEANTGANLGAGADVYASKSGVALQFRGIVGGDHITAVQTAQSITLNTDAEPNLASNLGSGTGVYVRKDVETLRFRTLVAGNNVTITNTADTITINSTGGGGGSGITSINQQTGAAQSIIGDTAITVTTAANSHAISVSPNSIADAQLTAGSFPSITGIGNQLQTLEMNGQAIKFSTTNPIELMSNTGNNQVMFRNVTDAINLITLGSQVDLGTILDLNGNDIYMSGGDITGMNQFNISPPSSTTVLMSVQGTATTQVSVVMFGASSSLVFFHNANAIMTINSAGLAISDDLNLIDGNMNLYSRSTNPTTPQAGTGQGKLFNKLVAGVPKPHWIDDDGNVWQVNLTASS